MSHWFRRRLLDPLLAQLRQGTSPEQLALCVALGVVIGNIPMLGVSTAFCTVVAWYFRLNLAAIQVVQACMAPTQLLLIIPFVRLGEWLTRAPPQPLSIHAGLSVLAAGTGQAVMTLWGAIVHAAIAWLLVAPFIVVLVTRLLAPLFARLAASRADPAGP